MSLLKRARAALHPQAAERSPKPGVRNCQLHLSARLSMCLVSCSSSCRCSPAAHWADPMPHLLLIVPVHSSTVVAVRVGNELPDRTRAPSATGFCDTGFANGASGFGLLLLGPCGPGQTAITLVPTRASAWGRYSFSTVAWVTAIGQG